MFGIDLNPTRWVDLATRLGTAVATGGQSELLRLASDMADHVLSDLGLDLPDGLLDIAARAYRQEFGG